MNILLLNDASMREALLARGHKVVAAGVKEAPYALPGQRDFDIVLPSITHLPIDRVLKQLPAGFEPEVVIHSEIHTHFFYLGIEDLPIPTVFRSVDAHIHGFHPELSSLYDITFVAQRATMDAFQARSASQCHFLPVSCFPREHFDRARVRDLDITFIGTVNAVDRPLRAQFIEAILDEDVPLQVFAGLTQTQISETYNRSKIVLNEYLNNDLNYRVFETMANGAVLLTPFNEHNAQNALFREGEHFVGYRAYDAKDAAEKCRTILSDYARYEPMSKRAQSLVFSRHRIEDRAAEMLAVLKQYSGDPQRRKERLTWDTYKALFPVFGGAHGSALHDGGRYVIARMRELDRARTDAFLISESSI